VTGVPLGMDGTLNCTDLLGATVVVALLPLTATVLLALVPAGTRVATEVGGLTVPLEVTEGEGEGVGVAEVAAGEGEGVGVGVGVVQDWVGHKSYDETMNTYGHLFEDDIKIAASIRVEHIRALDAKNKIRVMRLA